MTAITYTARDSIISGHTAGTQYSMDVAMSQIDRGSEAHRKRRVSLSGKSQTIFHRRDELWQFSTLHLDGTELSQMREFVDSVMRGEAFTIDPYGTVASADAPFSAKLRSESYSENRLTTAGNEFAFSFEVRRL